MSNDCISIYEAILVANETDSLGAFILEVIKRTQNWETITYAFSPNQFFDGSGSDVDVVFEPVEIDGWCNFENFVRINGQIRLATDFRLHMGKLDFFAWEVPENIARRVERNIHRVSPAS